ncbi:hypothetical protein BC938DRAFT_482615 [Jimgerdemannia flammicorona]|uniref:MULE transposase domain-containing protein n=1 Tax=Jimgerdemannia flammicorona TaxID=994334 RepID=A0A433QDQ3_9FUNG|nr:hypothetical protein BC938DRAFT_482615 [Jimgerdemannia flammicorona]
MAAGALGVIFYASNQDGMTVSRNLAPEWYPRYMLSDQSNVEANSITTAFPGMFTREMCEFIWCTVHVMRTWMTKIYHSPTRSKMVLAMHKKTQNACDKLVQEAIRTLPIPSVSQYITRNYVKTLKKLALWARQHSPLDV